MRTRFTPHRRSCALPSCMLIAIAAYSAYDAETVRVRHGPDTTRSIADAIYAVWGSPLVLGNVWIPFVLLSAVPAVLRSQRPDALIRFGSLSARALTIGVVRQPMRAVGFLSAGVLVTVVVALANDNGTDAIVPPLTPSPTEFITLGLGLVGGTTLLCTALVTTVSMINRSGTAITIAIACWLYSAVLSLHAFPVFPVLTPWYWFRVDQPASTPAALVSYALSVAAGLLGCIIASRMADERIRRRAQRHA